MVAVFEAGLRAEQGKLKLLREYLDPVQAQKLWVPIQGLPK